MFFINKDQLQKVIKNDYNLYSFESFYNSHNQFLIILTKSECFGIEFDTLFENICNKCHKREVKNHVALVSVDGCIGVGKSTLIKLLKPNLEQECVFLDEPLSIWQSIYYYQDSGLNILEMFYQSIANDSTKPDQSVNDMPYYFQSLVIFSRWLVLVYSKNSDIFLSERSVFSDRCIFINK
jgi:hypothetical protein